MAKRMPRRSSQDRRAWLMYTQDDFGARTRVVTALILLVGSKVGSQFYHLFCMISRRLNIRQILNVQVPFYFKSIIDSLNVDFVAIGGTAWTVGGAMIVACT